MNLTPEKEYRIKYYMDAPPAKVIIWKSGMAAAKTSEQAKFVTERVMHKPAVEFYNMQQDPFELKNLASDPKNKALIAQYKAKLETWMQQQGDAGAALDKPYARK